MVASMPLTPPAGPAAPRPRPRAIYKILSRQEYEALERDGRFDGAPVDRRDGYIHFSLAHQVAETARRHFSGREDLMLVAVDPGRLGAALVYEPSRGGDLFPHLYGAFTIGDVLWAEPLPLEAGVHRFPELPC